MGDGDKREGRGGQALVLVGGPPLLQSVTGPEGGWALPSGLVSSAWGGAHVPLHQ